MAVINNFLANFGWPIMYFMAFLVVMALINQICNFFGLVLKWRRGVKRYTPATYYKKFNF